MAGKRIIIFTAAVLIVLLPSFLLSCSGGIPEPVENEDGTVSWNGWTLTRAVLPYPYREYNLYSDIIAKPNVLAGDEQSLSLVVERYYKHSPDFGTEVNIQVLLSGRWYTVPDGLSGEPFVLPPLRKKEKLQTPMEYETDLAGVIDLPPGAYRLAEEALEKPGGDISTWYARFWVKRPYEQSPPEAATEGKARLKDIVLSADSSYPAQRAITTEDDMFTLVVENLSGKTYKPVYAHGEDNGIILERLAGGRWIQIPYSAANTHSQIAGWNKKRMEVFVFDSPPEGSDVPAAPLSEGRYRIRFPMETDSGGLIEPSCEFDVLSPEDAPPPEWDIDELWLSEYEGMEWSDGVTMTPVNPAISGDEVVFNTSVSVDRLYTYGSGYILEALIGKLWYGIPFSDAQASGLVAYRMPPDGKKKTLTYDITSNFGKIPPGRYRIIEEFRDEASGVYEYTSTGFTYSE